MARGVNKVLIIGNLGQDPEVKYMPNGNAVTNVTVATSESWKDKETGQQKDRTEWHRVVFFGKLAEIAGQYLHKGSKVYVEGALRTRKWQDQSGADRYSTEIVVDMKGEMQMLDSKGDNQAGGNQPASQNQQRPAQQPQTPPGYNPKTQGVSQQPQQAAGFDDFVDDIPF